MRTDTATFATRAFKAVRALGVNSVRSKDLARQIASTLTHGGYNALGETIAKRTEIADLRLELVFAYNGHQSVSVSDGDERLFCVTCANGNIVSTKATPRQMEMKDRLSEARQALFAVTGDICRDWDAANGHPATDEAADDRHADVTADPRYVAARATYDALRDESLTLNPFAPAHVVDPLAWGTFSDWYKDEVGCRPGHEGWNHAQVMAWIDRRSADEPMDMAA